MVNTTHADSERLVLFGSFTSSSSYKPMLYLSLSSLPFSFRTVNLKNGVQKQPDYLAINRYGQVPALRHRGLTIVQSNVIMDYQSGEDIVFRTTSLATGTITATISGTAYWAARFQSHTVVVAGLTEVRVFDAP